MYTSSEPGQPADHGPWLRHKPTFACDQERPSLRVSPWAGHRRFAYDLVGFTRPARVVELGTHFGCSLFCFLQADRDLRLGAKFHAVDTWQGDPDAGSYGEDVFQAFCRTLQAAHPGQDVHILRKTFDAALHDVPDGSIDLLHIDGFHAYEAVQHDYETWVRKVAPNGIVLFHDVAPASGYGSARYWDELKATLPHFEFLSHSFGLGVLFPKGDQWHRRISRELPAAWLDLYQFQALHELAAIQLADAQATLVARMEIIDHMDHEIAGRDALIAESAKTVAALEDAVARPSRREQVLAEAIRAIPPLDLLRHTGRSGQEVTLFPEMALTLYLFVVRLYAAARAAGARDLCFLSREGFWLKRLFDLYQDTLAEDAPIRTHYLLASRRSTFLMSLKPLPQEDFSTLFRQYRAISIHDFLESLGLQFMADAVASQLNLSADELRRTSADLPTDPCFRALLNLPVFQQTFEAERLARSSAFGRYLDQLLGPACRRKLHLVDVGWKGTIQDNLFLWLATNQAGFESVTGYYVGLVAPGISAPANQKRGLLFSYDRTDASFHAFNENRALFEVLLHADHGSVCSYAASTDGSAGALLDDFGDEAMVVEAVAPVMAALAAGFERIAHVAAAADIPRPLLESAAVQGHARMVFDATEHEIKWFLSLSHAENFGAFGRSQFGVDSQARPSLIDRLRFTLSLAKPRGRMRLGFWPWLALKKRAVFGVAALYRHKRRTAFSASRRRL